MKKYLLLSVLILTGFNFSYAQELSYPEKSIYSSPLSTKNQAIFKQIQERLSKTDNLSGNFTQTRYMSLLAEPLQSSGYFILSKNKGLTWVQIHPFKSSLIVTKNELIQKIENNPPTILNKQSQPIVFSFTEIFLSMFNGNVETLERYFTVYFSGTSSVWEIALVPKTAPLNKAISSIELNGGEFVNRITINEAEKNKMIIQFKKIKIATLQ